jgi:nucleoside-diphosphate-sugar epimerase
VKTLARRRPEAPRLPAVATLPTDFAVAIVTGGSQGIGRAIARALARRDYAVALTYLRDQRQAEAAVDAILAAGGTALAVRADSTDDLDVERLFDETEAAFGSVQLVVDTATCGTSVVARHAARHLRHGGTIVTATGAQADAAEQLRARSIALQGLEHLDALL